MNASNKNHCPRIAIEVLMTCFFVATNCYAGDKPSHVLVKSTSKDSHFLSIEAELAGKRTELICFLSEPHCLTPEEGEYVMYKVRQEDGIYMDCANVELHRESSSPNDKEVTGVYCWLEGPPDNSKQ